MIRAVYGLLAILCLLQVTTPRVLDEKLLQELQDAVRKEDASRIEEKAGLFEGDIDMDEGMRRALIGGKLNTRDAVRNPIYRWPDGMLYYTFDEELGHFTIQQIHKAMDHLKRYTCIRFQRVNPAKHDGHYVKFFQGHGCYSRVGKDLFKREQEISIGEGCTRLGTIAHEIMHTLGFFHEQSRPDSDHYITIQWENIKPEHAHNFHKYPHYLGTNLGKPYDYHSVMHYSRYAFSKNDRPTILPTKINAMIGQRLGLSHWDAYQINALYGCHGKHEGLTDQADPFACVAIRLKNGFCNKKMHKVCARTCHLKARSRHILFLLLKKKQRMRKTKSARSVPRPLCVPPWC